MAYSITFADTRLDDWNQFVLNTPSTSSFITSHWLNSYMAFGMRTRYLIATQDGGEIIGGAALAEFRLGPFAWLQVPHSPLVVHPDPALLGQLVSAIEDYASDRGAMVVQITPFEPSHDHTRLQAEAAEADLTYDPDLLATAEMGVSGVLLGQGYQPVNHIRLFSIPDHGQIVQLSSDDLLMKFRPDTRRNIRAALKSEMVSTQVSSLAQLKVAYEIMQENATRQGYPLRPWKTFESAVWSGIENGTAAVFLAEYQDQAVATVVVAFGGKRGAYVMGGTQRISGSKVYPAHLLQYTAMQDTWARGYPQYDLTSLSTSGVAEFKRGFRPSFYRLNGTYSKLYKPRMVQLFLRSEPWLRANRRRLARVVYFGKAVLGKR